MSELIAEARVLVRPDTTAFRTTLIAEVNQATTAAQAAVKPIVVPVATTVAGASTTTQAAAAAQGELAVTTAGAAAATESETAALNTNSAATARNTQLVAGATAARERSAAAAVAESRGLGQATRGIAATAASFAGLRGATLAASGAFLGGTVAAVAFAKAIGSAASFESQLNVFRVTAGATADEMKRVGDEAQALGRDITLPAVSANDAATAMTELSKAGLSVQDSMAGARGVLQLATAAQIDNAAAAQIAASALNAFGLAGDQAVHVADVLTNAANLSQGSISDMGLALQQSAAVARQVGLSLEDTVKFLTDLSRAGIKGSDAGTSLRVSLIRLINPTEKAQKILDKFNVTLRDQQGNIRPDVFRQLAEAQAGLTRAQQDANAAVVFGTDGLRFYSIEARQTAQQSLRTAQALDKQGSAAKLSGARMQGLVGATENLKNQLSGLGLIVGKAVVPALTDFANQAAAAVGGVTELAGVAGTAIGPLVEMKNKLDDITHSRVLAFAPITAPFGLGIKALGAVGNILGGEAAGRHDGTVTAESFNEAVKAKFGDIPGFLQDALDRAKPSAEAAGSDAGKLFGAGFKAAVTVSVPEATQSALDLALAQSEGNQTKELQVLVERRNRQQAFLDRVLARKPTTSAEAKKNAELARQAAENLTATKAQIKAIFDQRNSAAQQAASDAERTRQKNLTAAQRKQQTFDENFLAQQARSRQQQANRISTAEQTPQAADDLAQQRRNLVLINAQITALNNSKVSEKAKQAAIDALITARVATTGAIKTLQQADAEQARAIREQQQDLNVQIQAQIVGLTATDKDDEAFFRAQIKRFQRQAIALGKATVAGKQATSKALGFVEQLKQLLLARADAQKETDKQQGQQGTSVADLLRENARVFAESGSNLIGQEQPFGSTNQFTNSISRFLTAGQKPQIELVTKPDPVAARIDLSIQKLIDALNANTTARTGGGASVPGSTGTDGVPHGAGAAFYRSRVARNLEEARHNI